MRFLIVLVVAIALPNLAALAQSAQPCQAPSVLLGGGKNIFTDEQEVDLGDAIAEHIQHEYRVIEDDEVTAYLTRIGERIVSHLPPNKLQFRFSLVDLPEANAFAMPGGRVYVSRKLVAFAKTEDELAGIIGHEMGHVLAHQTAIRWTRLLQDVLGITEVKDRRDIFDKYSQLIDNRRRKPKLFKESESEEDKHQLVADQIGIFAVAGAGYDPEAHARIFDRLAETRGKTGSFFSDLFGTTSPDAKRLREIVKGVAALPPSCREARAPATAEDFQKWQSMVLNYTGLGRKEALHAVISRVALDPPLRGEIKHLRFSPDGKYLLAQDDSAINVLSHEPFAVLFRIDAPGANYASFTPDSHQVVFASRNLRVEAWSIPEQALISAHEMIIRPGCLQTSLSPDGGALACLDGEFNLDIYEVATGAQVFQKKSFYVPDPSFFVGVWLSSILGLAEKNDRQPEFVNMEFSPDGRYFVAGHRTFRVAALGTGRDSNAVVVDMNTKTAVPLKDVLKTVITGSFAFLGPNRVVGEDATGWRGLLVSFPSGDILDLLPNLGVAKLGGATGGNFLFLRSAKTSQIGVMDLNTKNIAKTSKTPAIDIFGQEFAAERLNGEVGLYKYTNNEILAKVLLPRNPLGQPKASAVSPDFKWLAVSERARGAVWDLSKGERLFHLRGFRGAYFGEGSMLADFPEFNEDKRNIARLDLTHRQLFLGTQIREANAAQYGPFVLVVRNGAGAPEVVTRELGTELNINADRLKALTWSPGEAVLEVHEAATHKVLWTRSFPKGEPRIWVDGNEGTMVLAWSASSAAAKAEMKNDDDLTRRLLAAKDKEGVYFLQVLNAHDGKPQGALLIETGKGSFFIKNVTVAGDWVVVTDTDNRVLLYSLSARKEIGRTFGSRAAAGKASRMLCVENEGGQLTIYDMATMEKRDHFTFSGPVSLMQFSDDGRRLFVLTASQTAYVLDLSGVAAPLR